MADPKIDHDFVIGSDGRIDLDRSPFFDVGFGDHRFAEEYIDRVSPLIVGEIESHMGINHFHQRQHPGAQIHPSYRALQSLHSTSSNSKTSTTAPVIEEHLVPPVGMFQKAEWLIYGSFSIDAELDTVAYNTYIKAMLDSGKLHLAIDIYDRMIAAGVHPSLQTYNTMISVYGKGGKLNRAIEMFNAAVDLGPSIDEKTYTNMISYYGKWGRIQEASLLFSKMKEGGVKPGKISYNTMINAYATTGLHSEAESIFKDMERDGHSPDSISYLALVRSYTQSRRYCDAEKVISRMQEAEIFPSCAHFNHLIFALVREGSIGDAERVYNLMKQTGLDPDLACCRTMLRTYMDYGLVNEGLFFFESTNGLIKSDGFILSAAAHLYEHVGKQAEAGKILDTINLEGLLFLRNLTVGSKLRR